MLNDICSAIHKKPEAKWGKCDENGCGAIQIMRQQQFSYDICFWAPYFNLNVLLGRLKLIFVLFNEFLHGIDLPFEYT